MKYLDVFLENTISKIDVLYTYSCPSSLEIKAGSRVVVPFGRGNKKKIAVVIKIKEKNESNYEPKEIYRLLDHDPIINDDLIELGLWMSQKYLTGISKTFTPIIPPGDIKKIKKSYEILDESGLKEEEKDLLEKIKNNKVIDQLSEHENQILKQLLDKNKIKTNFLIQTFSADKFQKYLCLNDDYDSIIKSEKISITQKQLSVIEYLKEKGEKSLQDTLKDLNISNSPVNNLEKKQILKIYDKKIDRNPYNKSYENKEFELNREQKEVLAGIKNMDDKIALIHGQTGSGKTELYLRLAEDVIKKGGQVIVLVPEISLTPQMIERFKNRFKDRVATMHSRLSLGQRYDSWQKIKNQKVDLVVGARSAVFAPFKNLKMIIVDEEHDSSYTFHNALRYDAIEVAKKRMEIKNGKLILGSATPDVCDYYAAKNGKIKLFQLKNRAVEGAKLPEVDLVDMREELARGNTSIFSAKLLSLIKEKLENKEQIILFLNRRGFSNFVSCRKCGYVIRCDNCDISMTYHRTNNILRCHYCGSTKRLPERCPSCSSKYIKQFGIGTQKVEDEIKKLFPQARIIRMDKDTMNTKTSYEETYESMKNNEADILIGTQMLAKGLDFKNLNLVGVIAADLSLFIADYKANETTFQLLTQVAGRSGRSNKEGLAVIQSYKPENYAIEYAKNFDYEGFYETEIQMRKRFNYPPFTKMLNIYFVGKDDIRLVDISNKFLENLSKEIKGFYAEHTRVISMPRINNEYKSKISLKVTPENIDRLADIVKRVINKEEKVLDKYKVYIDIEFI